MSRRVISESVTECDTGSHNVMHCEEKRMSANLNSPLAPLVTLEECLEVAMSYLSLDSSGG
jgi:hypothetical protein